MHLHRFCLMTACGACAMCLCLLVTVVAVGYNLLLHKMCGAVHHRRSRLDLLISYVNQMWANCLSMLCKRTINASVWPGSMWTFATLMLTTSTVVKLLERQQSILNQQASAQQCVNINSFIQVHAALHIWLSVSWACTHADSSLSKHTVYSLSGIMVGSLCVQEKHMVHVLEIFANIPMSSKHCVRITCLTYRTYSRIHKHAKG